MSWQQARRRKHLKTLRHLQHYQVTVFSSFFPWSPSTFFGERPTWQCALACWGFHHFSWRAHASFLRGRLCITVLPVAVYAAPPGQHCLAVRVSANSWWPFVTAVSSL